VTASPETRSTFTPGRPRLVLTVCAGALVALWLFPVAWMILTSFKPSADITNQVPLFIFRPVLEHYTTLFGTYNFGQFFATSFAVAAAVTVITMALGSRAAYALGCIHMARSKDIAMWILSQRMLPPIAVVLPFFILFRRFGLIDTPAGLIVVYLVPALPFAVWLLRSFFLDTPAEVREAALLDGLRHEQILRRIVAPIASPGIAVTAIFTFIFTWNEFLFALFLTSERATTVPVGISQLVLAYQVLWGEVSAAGTLALIPLLPVVFALQRHIVRGMTLGAVK
jgi:multiple sugar transport system permease protein